MEEGWRLGTIQEGSAACAETLRSDELGLRRYQQEANVLGTKKASENKECSEDGRLSAVGHCEACEFYLSKEKSLKAFVEDG